MTASTQRSCALRPRSNSPVRTKSCKMGRTGNRQTVAHRNRPTHQRRLHDSRPTCSVCNINVQVGDTKRHISNTRNAWLALEKMVVSSVFLPTTGQLDRWKLQVAQSFSRRARAEISTLPTISRGISRLYLPNRRRTCKQYA